MKCYKCDVPMRCCDDAVDEYLRADWTICPRCGAKGEILYADGGKKVAKVTWDAPKKGAVGNG